ncbi:MAG: glycosyltransferase family 39 protein [Vulcanimicrobiaceae bacterium]
MKFSSRLLLAILVLFVAIGIACRIEHIERRSFWTDESWTALRLSGHTYAQVRSIFDGRIHTAGQIMALQKPTGTVAETVAELAREEPQHPPAFYVLAHYWSRLMGGTPAAIRALALTFGLLAIVAVYQLCMEINGSRAGAVAASALMAVSPFFVDYAGQAREYTMWAALTAYSSTLLLRALRSGTRKAWFWYGGIMVLGLYSAVLMAFVLLGHGLYVACRYLHDRRVLVAFGCAATASVALFAPWIAFAVDAHARMSSSNEWLFTPYPVRIVAEKWLFNAGSVLFDAEYANLRLIPIAGAMLLVVLAGCVAFFREERHRSKWLLAAVGGAIALPQIAVDLAAHGHESTIARYMVPLWLVMLIGLGLFLGRRIERPSGALSVTWIAVLCGVLAVASASSVVNSSAIGWWDNNDDYPWTKMAAEINVTDHPLVVSEGHWAAVLVMSHYVKPDTRFLLFTSVPTSLPLTQNAFLLAPSQRIADALQRRYKFRVVPIRPYTQASAAVAKFHDALDSAGPRAGGELGHAFLARFVRPVAVR